MSTNAGNDLLLDRIVATPRRETGGSVAANRTDFQQSWAFCLLLTLHEKPDDYAVLLDFHDDVVVLNSATDPTEMEFFQVKSRSSGNWTITQLLKCPKGKDDQLGNSICGKMYANKLAFPNVTKSLNFVTNAQFRMSLKPDGKETEVDQFELKQLTDEIGKKYSDAVRKEHKLSEELADVPTIFFTEALPHNGHEDQTRGRFAAFLEKKNPKGKFAVSAAFRTIASVIAKRTGEERQPSSRESLLLLKAITRANFSEMLATIMEEDEEDRWKDIGVALISEQYAYGYIQRLRGAWNKYHVQQMDAANTPVQRLKESAIEIATDFVREKPEFKLRELIDEGVPLLRQSLGAACPFDDHSLSAALIYHCHENESLSPTVA